MLHKAEEWRVIFRSPKFRLVVKEYAQHPLSRQRPLVSSLVVPASFKKLIKSDPKIWVPTINSRIQAGFFYWLEQYRNGY
jgi:hypothetical protein